MSFWKDLGKSFTNSILGLPGSLIQGGIGLVGSLFESRQSRKAWEAQNAYNDPAMQMERYKAAGLNPNLVYSQGSPGNATSTYQAPKMDAMSRNFNLLQQAQMVYGIRNQNKEVEASVNLKNSQAEYYEAMKNLRILDHEYYNQANPIRIANLAYQGNYLQALKAQAEERTRQIWLDNDLNPLRKLQLTRQIKKTEKEIRVLGLQYDAVKQNIQESISRVGLNNARTQMLIKEKEKIEKELEYYGEYLSNRNKFMGLDRLIGMRNSMSQAMSAGYNASQLQLPLFGKMSRPGAFNDFLDSMSKHYQNMYDDYFAY